MDTEVVKTFLEIVAQGTFRGAAERLHVAQTTVSARMRLLEQRLGQPVFVRNKSGATLTPAGERFLRYAPTFVQLWERARHQVAIPPSKQAVLAIGGELSLWSPLLLKWLVWMREYASEIAVRATVGVPEHLLAQVADGVLDIAVLYCPQHRPGLEVEMILDEKLVLVTTDAERKDIAPSDYVYVDWGEEFAIQHGLSFPEMDNPGLFVGLGPLALGYILEAGGAGYFRLGAVAPYLRSGQLHRIPGAPEFSYPAYAVHGARGNSALIRRVLGGLREAALEMS